MNNYMNLIPEQYRSFIPAEYADDYSLLYSIEKFVHGAKDVSNPYYKVFELLRKDQLDYEMLTDLKKFYRLDLVSYLTIGNRGEYYFGEPCHNLSELKRALRPKYNKTDNTTLRNILVNLY